jgi:hypothetical protein
MEKISTRNADSERACMQARSGADSATRTTGREDSNAEGAEEPMLSD